MYEYSYILATNNNYEIVHKDFNQTQPNLTIDYGKFYYKIYYLKAMEAHKLKIAVLLIIRNQTITLIIVDFFYRNFG